VCTDRCSQVWQRHIDCIRENAYASDTHSDGSARSDSQLRRRYRTMNMLGYFAAEPGSGAYAVIIEAADDQIIKGIRGAGRAFIQGSLADLSPLESLALGRYRKSIEGLSDHARWMECTRRALLKPGKARGCVPASAVCVPMLLTFAITRGGLETYVDDDDDGGDVSSFTGAYFEDSHDSSNDDNQHSSPSEDSEDSTNDASEETSEPTTEDSSDQGDDGSEETRTKQSEQSDGVSEEASSTEQSDQRDEGSERPSAE
jgi:hypothetical protein